MAEPAEVRWMLSEECHRRFGTHLQQIAIPQFDAHLVHREDRIRLDIPKHGLYLFTVTHRFWAPADESNRGVLHLVLGRARPVSPDKPERRLLSLPG